MNAKLTQIILKLKEQRKDEKYIIRFVEDLQREAENRFFDELKKQLTETDMQEVEKEEDVLRAQELLKAIFEKKTGKKAEVFMEEILNALVPEFYEDYETVYKTE